MRRRDVTTGLIATGIAAPYLLRGEPAEAEGNSAGVILTAIVITVAGLILTAGYLGVLNSPVKAISLSGKHKFDHKGDSQLRRAHKGTKVGNIYFAHNTFITPVDTQNVKVPNKGRIINGRNTWYPTKKLELMDVGWTVTESAVRRGRLVGELWVYKRNWYANFATA